MLRITIETIPHQEQRYPTVGDYLYEFNKETGFLDVHIKVSALSDWREEALVAVHELVEIIGVANAGIPEEAITAFDVAFESSRDSGSNPAYDEPGNDPASPYFCQHRVATLVERDVADMLSVDWNLYEEHLDELYNPQGDLN